MVLIAGGTGRLGRAVVEALTARQMRVRVLSRDRARGRQLNADPALLEAVEGDVRDPESLTAAVAGTTTVISSVQGLDDRSSSPEKTDHQGNRNLVDAAVKAGVEHFIFVSAQPSAPDHPMVMARAKFAAEQYLKSSPLAWTIIRPSAFMEFWATLVGAPLAQTGRTRVFGRGENPQNFVSICDVATAVEHAVFDESLRGVELEMGGPENLTVNQVVEIVQQVTGRKGRVRHVPVPAMRVMAVLMRPINAGMARIIQTAILADAIDLTWDGSANRKRYPWLPQTPLRDVLQKRPELLSGASGR